MNSFNSLCSNIYSGIKIKFQPKNALQETQKADFITALPRDCIFSIFYCLNAHPGALYAPGLVNKQWRMILQDKIFKNDDFQKMIFGPLHWAKFVKKGKIKDEEVQEAFSLLPCPIYKLFNQTYYSEESIKKSNLLVYFPREIKTKEITINSFKKFKELPLPCDHLKRNLDCHYPGWNQYTPIDHPHWVLISKELFKNFSNIPKFEIIAEVIQHFIRFEQYTHGVSTFTWCKLIANTTDAPSIKNVTFFPENRDRNIVHIEGHDINGRSISWVDDSYS